jgi:hypothetical protein
MWQCFGKHDTRYLHILSTAFKGGYFNMTNLFEIFICYGDRWILMQVKFNASLSKVQNV